MASVEVDNQKYVDDIAASSDSSDSSSDSSDSNSDDSTRAS